MKAKRWGLDQVSQTQAYKIPKQQWQYLFPPSFTETDAPKIILIIYGKVH